MTEGTKKKLNIASAAAIIVGVVGYVLTGGSEADAINIVSVGVASVGAIVAAVNAIRG